MLGAIVGDIIGSVYERHNIKTKDFPLFREDCRFTDDTVMTCAVAEAVMNGGQKDDFIDAMKKYGRMYPNAGYGRKFHAWINSNDRKPYHSLGNGSAMRVSPCAWVMDCGFMDRTGCWPKEGSARAELSAAVTHDHPEGVLGAEAAAGAVFLARTTKDKEAVRSFITGRIGYDLSRTCDEIRPGYRFDVSCRGTLPEAVTAFLEGTDFEDVLRTAVSLGGDCDTLTCIACSIAEALYGIPEDLKEGCRARLTDEMVGIAEEVDLQLA